MMQKNYKLSGFRVLLFIITALAICTAPAIKSEAAGGDSPQAVFDSAQAAGAKKDFTTLTQLVAPSERSMYAFATDMAVGMFVEFYEGEKAAKLKSDYQAIQKKYGIDKESEKDDEKLKITNDTPQEVIDAHIRKRAEKLYGKVDVVKFVPELMAIIVAMPEMAEQNFFPQEKLTDLKIDGDRATGKAGKTKLAFIKEDNRWYLSADFMN